VCVFHGSEEAIGISLTSGISYTEVGEASTGSADDGRVRHDPMTELCVHAVMHFFLDVFFLLFM
jgi:hypothetical protein